MCLSCICLLAMHTLICVTFSLPPGVGGWLRLLLVALPGLFYLPFRQPDVHHSEEGYLELLDSFNGVTETYHLTSLTVSPGVTEPYHLTLLASFVWRYWTVSPDVIGQFHLALLNRITCRFWTVSFIITEPTGQFHLAFNETYHLTLQDSNRTVQYATTNSLMCDCFLK